MPQSRSRAERVSDMFVALREKVAEDDQDFDAIAKLRYRIHELAVGKEFEEIKSLAFNGDLYEWREI